VLALSPGDARAANDLGIAYADAGEAAQSARRVQRATTVDPVRPRWNNYGNAFVRPAPDAAAEAFAHAVAAEAGLCARLGESRRRAPELGDDANAETALRALALNPVLRAAIYTLAGLRPTRDASTTRRGSIARRQGSIRATRTRRCSRAARSPSEMILRAQQARSMCACAATPDFCALRSPSFDAADGGGGRACDRRGPKNAFSAGLDVLHDELPRRMAALGSDRRVDELPGAISCSPIRARTIARWQMRFGALVLR